MNKLLSTTALVVALSVPAMAFAQSTGTGTQTETQQQQNGTSSGFMAARGQSDIFASELIGHDVYARSTAQGETRSNDGQARSNENEARLNADGSHGMSRMNRSDLENMEQIGQINEIILSNDGQVRAIVIGVGGFLGMGEQDIAVTMDQVTFASDDEDESQMYVMVNTGADMLTDAPAYDRTAATTDGTQGDAQTRTDTAARTDGTQGAAQTRTDTTARTDGTQGMAQDQQSQRTGFAAPQMERDGFTQIEARDVSTEMLMGKSVYDTQDNDVGSIDDMLMDDDGKISHVIIDFGGFLGIGSSQAAIGYDELTILTTEGYSDVRVYVDATKDQIQNLPRYTARN